jgi:CIC family chloride channel protein
MTETEQGDGQDRLRRRAVSAWRTLSQALSNLEGAGASGKLGDFTTTSRVIPISILAIGIGVLSAYVALTLLRLIGLFTNLFFFHRWSTALVSPAGNQLGASEILVPTVVGLVIGVMANYGSERIRGHGIPEAIEAILISGSTVEPKVAILKPLSSALSIGSGGPFGAEGPIIMTGGALGSMIAQFFHLTAAERKTLLVAGAAGGMSATFASPVAAVLLAVELLLFEWKPRSLIPIALACATAEGVRVYLMGPGPLFPSPLHSSVIGPSGIAGCLLVGLLAGAMSALLTIAVYAAEDAFRLLPIHWMWWPALGGLAIGIGGLVFPPALGVGYDTIGNMVQGNISMHLIVGVLLVKSTIWAVSLGSGTSGGVLAPLLMMGGAVGGLTAPWLPDEGAGFWALVGMGAIMGGTMRSPFTGIVFAVELTHDVRMLFPLLVAVVVAHGFTVLTMRRSILTEKVARRGYHLTREYASDPLEIIFVREAMQTNIIGLPATSTLAEIARSFDNGLGPRVQRLYPIVDDTGLLRGVITRTELRRLIQNMLPDDGERRLSELLKPDPVVAYPDEPLRVVVYRMVETNFTQFPVVERDNSPKLVGLITLDDLLLARQRNLEQERRREQILQVRLSLPLRSAPARDDLGGDRPD